MSLKTLASKYAAHEPEPFVAPVPDIDRVSILVHQSGVPYRYDILHGEVGWYQFKPIAPGACRIIKKANIRDINLYLGLLPSIRAVGVSAIGNDGVLVVPENPADAAQKGWLNAEPRIAHILRGRTANMAFAPIIVRDAGGFLLYARSGHGVDFHASRQIAMRQALERDDDITGPSRTGYQIAYSILLQQAREQKRQEAARKARLDGEEGIRHQFEFTGARIGSIRQRNAGEYEVTYEYDGAAFTVQISRSGRVSSAGICLSGGDRDFDASSIVEVMQEARRRHRYDVDQNKWL